MPEAGRLLDALRRPNARPVKEWLKRVLGMGTLFTPPTAPPPPPPTRFPIHGYTLGYLGTRREPYTWFVCNNGHPDMGTPEKEPGADCFLCTVHDLDFTGWEVADPAESLRATMDAIGPLADRAELYRRSQRP